MTKCATCKHWQTPEGEWNAESICKPFDIDTDEPMVVPFEVRVCKHPALLFCERPVESNGFAVVDGSTYYAALCTGPDFGCVRHEEER